MKLPQVSARTLRRTLTVLALCLALGGAGLVAYPFATDLWATRIQGGLVTEFAAMKPHQYKVTTIKEGDPFTRLEIADIGVDTMVVEGTSAEALRAGAGHYPETPLPGEAGNVAIAGHRTTYGRPFNRIDELSTGDKIVLSTPVGRYVYEVISRPWVVLPDAWDDVVNDFPPGGSYLTLSSCHPEGSASHRIIVRAELVESSEIAQVGVN
ncbi:MAG: class E sortase [Actinomycetota bacterium]